MAVDEKKPLLSQPKFKTVGDVLKETDLTKPEPFKPLPEQVKGIKFAISVNGENFDVNSRHLVSSIQINRTCDGSNTAVVVVEDKDMWFLNKNFFAEEASIHISIMFLSNTTKIDFDGYIAAIDINFPETGIPTLSVTCMDKSHLLNRKRNKRSWDKVTRKDVAQKIAQEYGLKFECEASYSGKQEETISQSDKTDIEFLEQLASEEPDLYYCKVVGNTVVYKKKNIRGKAVANLHYKMYPYGIVSFSPQINKEIQLGVVEDSDISTDTMKVDAASSSGTSNVVGTPVYSSPSVPSSTPSSSRGGSSGNSGSSKSSAMMHYDPKSGKWSKR